MRATQRRTVGAGFALIALYLVLASLSPLHLIEPLEIFPFFSWSLFSAPKNRVTFYSLLLEKEQVAAVGPPQAFETRTGYVRLIDSPLARNIGLHKILATYSREASGDPDPAAVFERYRGQVESVVRGQATRYHLFKTVYDPIELFRERRYREARYVASYDMTEAGD